MKEGKAYDEQAKSLQKRAGIRTDEEMAGYDAGVEMHERRKTIHGYDNLLNAAAGARAARKSINLLMGDRKFNSNHKQELQKYLQPLGDIEKALTNIASAGQKPKQKTLEP